MGEMPTGLQAEVYRLMAEQDLTYAEVARRMGVTPDATYQLLQSLGKRKHQPALLARLARAFGKANDFFARMVLQPINAPESPQEPQEAASTTPGT